MKITYRDPWFIWSGEFQERRIPEQAGFEWIDRAWRTKYRVVAERLSTYWDLEAIEAAGNRQIKLNQSHGFIGNRVPLVEPPCPPGLSFLQFQKIGVQFMLEHSSCLLADEQGLGKTLEVVGVINALTEIKRVLIVCPASLKLNWAAELRKWLTRRLPVTNYPLPYRATAIKDGITIINYDILHKFDWKSESFDLLILDECQYCKNPTAKRTRLALSIKAKRKLFLTGTPILNRPIEIYPLLNTLQPGQWGSKHEFGVRYCGAFPGTWGWDYSGASRLDELNERLRSTIMIRRLKADVLKELPAKRRQIIELSGVLPKAETDFMAAVAGLKNPGKIAFEEIARVRHEDALAKLPACIEFTKDALEESEKIVVFAHHRDVVERLERELCDYKPVVITGSTSLLNRQNFVQQFQSDPAVRLLIGNIQAAGVGITLTAASHVIFVELDWTPGVMSQAEDRCHRIGQKDFVLVQHLVLSGSIDARMAKLLVKKQEVLDMALDRGGEAEKPLDVVEAILA